MPGFCTPWPGNRSAMGPASVMPTSSALRPLQERCAPGKSRSEPGQQHVVAALDAAVADSLLQRQGDGRARRVAVLVDVDGHPLHRKPDAARGGVDDAEV